MVIAIDFDNTLCIGHEFPNIGAPRLWLIEKAKQWKLDGHQLILYTCREDVLPDELSVFDPGTYLTDAINFCKSFGLEFDAHNQSIDELKYPTHKFSRKVFASVYIDDRSVSFIDNSEQFVFNPGVCASGLELNK